MSLNGLQDTSSSLDGRVEEILFGILDIEMEGRRSMKDVIEGRVRLDGLGNLVSTAANTLN
jgi:hypothetical protein